ncbi:unnamed protein product [Prunus armeniaca]
MLSSTILKSTPPLAPQWGHRSHHIVPSFFDKNILLPPQVPRVPSTPSGRIVTSIPSAITSEADMATTTSPAEATHTGQVIGLYSPSHPSLDSRSSPP